MLLTPCTTAVDESKTLFVIIPQTEALNVMQNNLLKGDPGKGYIGLRESVQLAFDRARIVKADVQPEECVVCAVKFSPLGWLHCTTTMVGSIPMLHKKLYNDGLDWGVWHFNAALPSEISEKNTNEMLVSVTFHPLTHAAPLYTHGSPAMSTPYAIQCLDVTCSVSD